jgi:HEAT repeat protein
MEGLQMLKWMLANDTWPLLLRRVFLSAVFLLMAATMGASGWVLWPEIRLQLLICDLSNADRDVRFHAAWAMSNFGNRAESAVPVLRVLLEEDDELVRTAAASSLVETGFEHDRAHTVLLQALSA